MANTVIEARCRSARAPLTPPPFCEGAFDALALLAAGMPCVMVIFGVQGWRWDWVRDVRELVFALDADTARQQPVQQFARQAVLRGKRAAGVPAAAYGGPGCERDVVSGGAGGRGHTARMRRAWRGRLSPPRAVCTAGYAGRCPSIKRGRVAAD